MTDVKRAMSQPVVLPSRRRPSVVRHRIGRYALRYIIVLAAVLFFGFPLFWIAAIAFKNSSEYFRNPPVWIPAHPNILPNLLLARRPVQSGQVRGPSG